MAVTVTLNGISYSIPDPGGEDWGQDLTDYFVAQASGLLQKAGGTFTLTAEVDFGATFGLKSAYYKSRATNPSTTGQVRLGNAESVSWRNAGNSADLALKVNASNLLEFNGTAIQPAGSYITALTGDVTATGPGSAAATLTATSNATLATLSALTSASSLASVGTITSGVWHGTAVDYAYLVLTGSVVNADISASAAIAYSKLNLAASIVNADISASAAIAYSKLNLALGIVNADVSASAAIALSKLAATTASRALVSDASGFVSPSAVTSTTLAFLDATSSVQTQLDAKVAKSTYTTKGDILVATAASTPARLAIGTDGQVPVADAAAASGLSWKTIQAGAKNYITYNNFENNATTGWSLCTVGAVDATTKAVSGALTVGTAASLSALATTSTNPLAGTYSLQTAAGSAWAQKEGFCSQTYTIDREDLAKPMSFRGYFEIPTGSSLVTASGTTTNSFAVWFYDVTNSAWVQPSGSFSMTQLTGVGVIQGSLQLPSTCTQFRLVIVAINAPTAGALTINWDDFSFGPVVTTVGTPITDWQAYIPASSAGFGVLSSSGLYWRKVGGNVEIRGSITVGTATAVEANIALPPGLTTTTDTNNNTVCGTYTRATSSTAHGGFIVKQNGVTYMLFGPNTAFSNTASIARNPDTGTNVASGEVITIECSIPILGWSSSVTMSSDSDTRVCAARAYNSSTAVGNGAVATIVYGTVDADSHGAYNSSTGEYTIPTSGWYEIDASAIFASASFSAAGTVQLSVYVGGSQKSEIGRFYVPATATYNLTVGGGDCIYLNAGQVVTIRINHGEATSRSLAGTSNRNYFSVRRVSGPAVVAASEKIRARYTSASGQTLAVGSTTIDFATKSFDTHGAVTTGASWKFTAPRADYFDVSACVLTSADTSTSGCDFYLYKNGSIYAAGRSDKSGTSSSRHADRFATSVYLLAGEYISVVYNNGTAGSLTLFNDSTYNYVDVRSG